MRKKWLTAFILMMATMLGGAIGVGVHGDEGSMANMPDCCKKAQSASNAPQAAMARLCCNLNCSEPGSTGTNNASSFSPQQGLAANVGVMPDAAPLNGAVLLNRQSRSPHRQDSNPKYIQHL